MSGLSAPRNRKRPAWLRPLFGVWAIWMLPAIVFTVVYTLHFRASAAAGLAHLSLIATTAFALLSVFSCALYFSKSPYELYVRRMAWGLSCLWLVFWCWVYAAFMIGLLAWGRVPTVSLLGAYADQIPSLLRVLSVSVGMAVAAAAIALLVPAVGGHFLVGAQWLRLATALRTARSESRVLKQSKFWSILLLATLGIAGQRWYAVALHPTSNNSDEPVYLALEPDSPHTAQSLIMNRIGDARRHQLEQQIRAAYPAQIAAHRYPTASNTSAAPVLRNVVLITVDALRPDHLGVHGYPRDTTPHLSAMQRQGRLWPAPEARSACAETSCGLLSLMTGKQPHELLTKNFGLTDVLALAGYQRTLLLSGDHTNFYKLREGYGSVDTYVDGTMFAKGSMNDDKQLLEQLRRLPPHQSEQPQFMFFHLMSVHGLGVKHAEHRLWYPSKTLYGTFSAALTPEVIDAGKNSYDNGVRQADWVISEIIAELTKRGILNANSIMLITADHAESLGEHGIKTHSDSVYESVIRIPWMWVGSAPPYAPLSTPAIQADFGPTLLSALQLPIPEHWSGIALQSAPPQRRTFHAQLPAAAVLDYDGEKRTKLVRDFNARTTKVFDLVTDPLEQSPRPASDASAKDADAIDALIRRGYGSTRR